jgi:oligoribonuclease
VRPGVFDTAPKGLASHRALDDIRESVAELRYYRETLFRARDDQRNDQGNEV